MRAFFVVDGVPKPKQRPRHTRNGHTYTPSETILAEQNIKAQYLVSDCPKFGKKPLHMEVLFCMPIPQSLSKKKRTELKNEPYDKKADIDNLIKLVMDSLNGVAFDDDKQIVSVSAKKKYSEYPRTEIVLEDI